MRRGNEKVSQVTRQKCPKKCFSDNRTKREGLPKESINLCFDMQNVLKIFMKEYINYMKVIV